MSHLRSLSPFGVLRGVAIVLAAAAAGLFLAPAVFGGGKGQEDPASGLASLNTTAPKHFSTTSLISRNLSRYTTLIATARHSRVRIYQRTTKTRKHGARTRFAGIVAQRRLDGQKLPLVFAVTDHTSRPGWLKVRLPVRPNGSAAWVKRSAVRISATNYRVTVELKRHRIIVKRGRFLVMNKPIGVGRAVSPTPRGRYYLTDLTKSTDPFYGPYAFGLSAYSTVYTSFGSGNGQVGLHGTDAPKGIGTNVSHGCIRMANAVIRRLAKMLPLGTPVRITY